MTARISNIEILQEAARILRNESQDKTARALDVFSKAAEEARNDVYGKLFEKKKFQHVYFGCGKDAFLGRNGLNSTDEEKLLAVECYLTQAVAKLHFGRAADLSDIHFLLGDVLRLCMQPDPAEGWALFDRLPLAIRQGVYKELYQLLPFERDYWGCAEDAFHDRNGQASSMEQKILAVQCCLLRSISDALGSGGDHSLCLKLLEAIPDKFKEGIYSELEEILLYAGLKDASGKAALFSIGDERVLQNDKAQAIGSYLLIFQGMMKHLYHEERLSALETKHLEKMIGLIREEELRASRRLPSPQPVEQPSSPQLLPPEPVEEPRAALIAGDLERLMASEPIAEVEEGGAPLFEEEISPLAIPFGSRSVHSNIFISGYSNYQFGQLKIGDQLFFPVTGRTQGFSRQLLVSCGSSPKRELLFLDPYNSPSLAKHFEEFRKTVSSAMSTLEILTLLKQYVFDKVFFDHESNLTQRVEDFASGFPDTVVHSDYPGRRIPMISIDVFTSKGLGVCRHHALVICYFLDRLLSEEEPVLEGTVQHMRSVIPKVSGAHIWAVFTPKFKVKESSPGGWMTRFLELFRPKRASAPAERFHIDSFWNVLINFADLHHRLRLRELYGDAVIDEEVLRTASAAKMNGQPEA